MGAVLNLRPELFNAAILGVPFVDCLTTMLDETIPLTGKGWSPEQTGCSRAVWELSSQVGCCCGDEGDEGGSGHRTRRGWRVRFRLQLYQESSRLPCCPTSAVIEWEEWGCPRDKEYYDYMKVLPGVMHGQHMLAQGLSQHDCLGTLGPAMMPPEVYQACCTVKPCHCCSTRSCHNRPTPPWTTCGRLPTPTSWSQLGCTTPAWVRAPLALPQRASRSPPGVKGGDLVWDDAAWQDGHCSFEASS